MADEIKTSVRQESYEVNGEGSTGRLRLNRRGELVNIDIYQQWVFDGRVFMASNAARETAEATGSTSFSDTDPALLLDVPSGKTAVPIEMIINQGGTVAGGNITFLVTLSDKIRYASGGVLLTAQNLRFDEPRSSSCRFYTGSTAIVVAANTDDLTLWGQNLIHDIDTLEGGNFNWSARKYIAPVLVGPAAMPIYAVASSTQPSFFYSIKWAEFDTTEVIVT